MKRSEGRGDGEVRMRKRGFRVEWTPCWFEKRTFILIKNLNSSRTSYHILL